VTNNAHSIDSFPLKQQPFLCSHVKSIQTIREIVKKRKFTFLSNDSVFQPVKKLKCAPEENQRLEDDTPSIAKSSSMCMSELSTHLNESRGKQCNGADPVRLKKLIKNRESAIRCRNKRKAAINSMINEIAQLNKDTEGLSLKTVKYNGFLEKLMMDNEVLGRKMSIAKEENQQLKLQLSTIHAKYAQMKQTVFTLYSQNLSIKNNGIKLQ